MDYLVDEVWLHRFVGEKSGKSGSFLRDGIASGRGVHQK